MWLDQLTVAVLERNSTEVEKLLENIPALERDEALKAAGLLQNLSEYLTQQRDETALEMRQLKKNIDFLNATEPEAKPKLDIKS
ncbi:MAG: hypothetical protein ABXS93_08650 [Sulfurimonas sp.]